MALSLLSLLCVFFALSVRTGQGVTQGPFTGCRELPAHTRCCCGRFGHHSLSQDAVSTEVPLAHLDPAASPPMSCYVAAPGAPTLSTDCPRVRESTEAWIPRSRCPNMDVCFYSLFPSSLWQAIVITLEQ